MNLPAVMNWPMVKGILTFSDQANYKRNQHIELNTEQQLIVRRTDGTRCKVVFNDDGTIETEAL